MRFKIDENVHPEVAARLRHAGHDAVTVREENLGGVPDANLAPICQAEHRALMTLDLDFADIRLYPPEQYPGIIVLRLGSQDRGHVLQAVGRMLPMLTEQTVAGHLWIVDEQSVRVRGQE